MIELGLMVTATFVLIMAHSATAIVTLGIFLLVLLTLRVPRLTGYVLGSLVVAVLLIVVGLVGDSFCVLSIVDRDCTFTGRTEIWTLAWSAIMERPWVGYGFGAFWAAGSEIGNAIRAQLGWQVASAHNAWLDTWLAIGGVGLSITILILIALSVKILQRAVIQVDAASDPCTVWSVGFLVSVWIYSLTEIFFPSYNTLTWVLFIVLAVKTEHFGYAKRSARLMGGGVSPPQSKGLE
jgi:exopolysaccharide production protein ExoQ